MRFPFNDHDGDITPKYANRSVGLYESVQNKGLPGRKLRPREPGAPQDDVQPPAAASVERDADPLFPAPDDVTRPFQLLARDHQREAIRNKQRGHDVEGGSGLREVPDCAAISLPANVIAPAFRMRRRGLIRCSFIRAS